MIDVIKRGRLIFLLFLAAAFLTVGCGNTDNTSQTFPTYQEAANVAQGMLPMWRAEMTENGGYRDSGFSNAEQANTAYFGEGYMIYYLDPEKFRDGFSLAPVKSMIAPANPRWPVPQYLWEFPVLSGDKTMTTFILSYRERSDDAGSWWHWTYYELYTPTVQTKGPDFVGSVRAKAFLSWGDPAEVYFIPLPQLATEMALVTTPYGELLGLSLAHEAFGLQTKDFYTRQELLPALRRELDRIVTLDLSQLGANPNHSSGNCTYQNAEAAALKYRHEHLAYLHGQGGYSYRQIFGDAPVDSIAVGKGYRLINIDYKAYNPSRSVRTLLHAEDCEWVFGLHVDGYIKSSYLIQYDQYTFKPLTGWGGTLPRVIEQIEAGIPDLLAKEGATVYSLYWVKDLPTKTQFALIVTDRGEFISFGPPPPDNFQPDPMPNQQDRRMFYRAEEAIQALKY